VRLRDRIPDPNIWRVYAATLVSGIAFGMALSIIAVNLHDRGFSKTDIGSLATWFAAGTVLLALPMSSLMKRFGPKATLAAAFFGYVVTVSLFPFLGSYAAIAGVRLVDGACSVAVWVSCETILLILVGAKNKGFVMSVYAKAMGIGYVVGSLISRVLVEWIPFTAVFVVAGCVALLAALYVALTIDGRRIATRHEPAAGQEAVEAASPARAANHATPAGSALGILWRIKNSLYATFAFGYFQASVITLLPIFMIEQKGIPREQTVYIPAFFASGMVLFISLGGRLGDRYGHLGVMRILVAIGTLMTLSFVFFDRFVLMGAAIFVAGATFATISPLSLALQGVVIHPTEYHRSNAIYNAFYAAGMLIGPRVSSLLFERVGGRAMLQHLAAIWAGFVIFSVIFRRDDPATGPARTPALAAGTPEGA
jgi:MFS family permease